MFMITDQMRDGSIYQDFDGCPSHRNIREAVEVRLLTEKNCVCLGSSFRRSWVTLGSLVKNEIMAVRVKCFGLFPFSGTNQNILLSQSLDLRIGIGFC